MRLVGRWRYVCLAYFLFHIGLQASHVMQSNKTGYDAAPLPKGCTVYNVTPGHGKGLSCPGVAFYAIPPALLSAQNYTSIEITYCTDTVGKLDKTLFVNTSALTSLTISGCFVSGIGPAAFASFVNLERLDLEQNVISEIDKGAFKGLDKLTKLSLNYQQGLPPLETIHADTFSVMANLEFLDLSNNLQLSIFPRNTSIFKGIPRLSRLLLNGIYTNDLPTDEEILAPFFRDQEYSMTELEMTGAHLSNRHLSILRNLKSLNTLDLRNNILGYIRTTSLPRLTNGDIFLQNNNIMFVEVGALQMMENVNIHLSDDRDTNPFNCDCNNWDFAQWIRTNRGNTSDKGVKVLYAETLRCAGPEDWYEKRLMDYNPEWWDCSPYVALIALVFIIGFVSIIAAMIMVVYCNRLNIKHWMLERRELATPEQTPLNETGPLMPRVRYINSLRQGKTGAYLIFNYKHEAVNKWTNKYLDENLQLHPMKITLQWPAGPEVTPMWKQIKDFSCQVNAFLVIVTDEFIKNHWPEIAEKSGIENIMKFVLVLFGKKRGQLPRELKRLQCPCFEWPTTGTRFTTIERSRDSFWKELRVCLKVQAR